MNDVIHQTDQKIKAAVDPINSKIDRFDSNMNANFKHLSDQMAMMFNNLNSQAHPPTMFHQGNPNIYPHSSIAASPMTVPHGATSPQRHE
jgi:hypothetical protein